MAEQRQTTKVALVVVLAVSLTFILVARAGVLPFGSHKGGTAAGSKGKAGKAVAGETKNLVSAGSVEVKWKRPDAIGPVVSDPMRMVLPEKKTATEKVGTAAPKVEPEWRVAGIIYSTQQPSSIIVDGRILHEGDTIHGATVVKITESHAEMKQGDKTWEISAGQTNKPPK